MEDVDWAETSLDEEEEIKSNLCLMVLSSHDRRSSSDACSTSSTNRRASTSDVEEVFDFFDLSIFEAEC